MHCHGAARSVNSVNDIAGEKDKTKCFLKNTKSMYAKYFFILFNKKIGEKKYPD